MTYESVRFTQADLRTVRKSTTERKKMSTKTSIKRIALVAVAGLGLGMVSIIPAHAANAFTSAADTATLYTSAGTAVSTTVDVVADADTAITGGTVTATMTTAPTGSSASVTYTSTGIETPFATSSANNSHQVTYSGNVATIAADPDGTGVTLGTTAKNFGTLNFTPDAPGKYVITLTLDAAFGSGSETNGTITVWASGVAGLVGSAGTGTTSLNAVTGGQAQIRYTNPNGTSTGTVYVAQSSGVGAIVSATGLKTDLSTSENPTPYNGSSSDYSAGATVTTATNTTPHQYTYVLTSAVAGTQTITITSINATTGAPTKVATQTITWGANVSNTYSAANSTVYAAAGALSNGINGTAEGTTPTSTTDASVASTTTLVLASAASTVEALKIVVDQEDAYDQNLTTAVANTVSISGVGLLGTAVDTKIGASVSETAQGSDFYVFADGRAGTSTITVSVNGSVVKTYTVIFLGTITSYKLTVANASIRVGDSSDAEVLTVAALDENGNNLPNETIYVSSGSTSVATVDASSLATDTDGTTTAIGVNGIAKGSAVITVGNTASSPTVSATATINVVTAGIASVALSFDKDEYAPGELVTVTVSAKNSDGVASGDATYANLFTSAGLVGSTVLQGYTAAASVTLTNGSKAYTFYAPLVEGPVVVKGTLDTSVDSAVQGTVVSKSVNVVAANGGTSAAIDAANEATDAANAATDAANAAAEAADAATAAAQDAQAAVAALATSVASLIAGIKAQITTLTNLVIKIQKKVKA